MSEIQRGVGRRPQIIPSIQTEAIEDFEQKIVQVQSWEWPQGQEKRVSVDIIDGVFVDNLTVLLEDLAGKDWGELQIDYQLMVEEPEDFLGRCHQAKATRVLAQIEKLGNRERFLKTARDYDFEVGWALDIYTPIEELTGGEIQQAPAILLMSVPVGFSGQAFKPQVLAKIKALRGRGYQGDILLDGGLNKETIPFGLAAGANQFCVTSAIWQEDDPSVAWKELNHLMGV